MVRADLLVWLISKGKVLKCFTSSSVISGIVEPEGQHTTSIKWLFLKCFQALFYIGC